MRKDHQGSELLKKYKIKNIANRYYIFILIVEYKSKLLLKLLNIQLLICIILIINLTLNSDNLKCNIL